MEIFDRLRKKPVQETIKPLEKRILVPNFEVNEELESLIKEYADLSSTMFGITHDYGIDINTDINKHSIQTNTELKEAAGRYFKARDRAAEIRRDYKDRLREYLRPYMGLENPPGSSFGIRVDEWVRFRMAEALEKGEW